MLSTGVSRASGLPARAITTSLSRERLIERRGELRLRFGYVALHGHRFDLCSIADMAPVGLMVNQLGQNA